MDTTTDTTTKERRVSLSYTFQTSLHDRLEKEGAGNRSRRAEELILAGLEAERAQPAQNGQ